MTTSPDTPPVARIGSPGELALVIPELLGYWPQQSLLVVSLGEPRGRVGLVQRIDLPPPHFALRPAEADEVLHRVVHDGGTRAVVVVFTEESDCDGALPRAAVVEALADAALRAGVELVEAICVRSGRWWCYTCTSCPTAGTPLEVSADAESVSLVAVERALAGRAVFGSRDELAASIAPAAPSEHWAQRLGAAAERGLAGAWDGEPAWRLAMLERYRAAMDALADPRHQLTETELCDLVVGLADLRLRDCVLAEVLDRAAALQQLLELLCRHALPPFDAPVCALLAWVSHVRGDGTLAVIAAERALADDPLYSAAHLVLDALEAAVAPELMRSSIELCRAETYEAAGLDSSGRRLATSVKPEAAAARRSRSRAR